MSIISKNEYLPVVIALREQFNGEQVIRTNKVKDERWRVTVSGLKELAARTQPGLLQELTRLEREGKARNITPLWIVNAVYCELVSEAILKVAERADVWFAQWNLIPTENALGLAPQQPAADVIGGTDSQKWHVRKVKADSVWYLYGYTGQGVVIGNIDTGCDYNHSDLANRMWTDPNYHYHGWDFENNDNDPMDENGHGTHTGRINAGDGTGGDTTGIAPGAHIMSCRTDRFGPSDQADHRCPFGRAGRKQEHVWSGSHRWQNAADRISQPAADSLPPESGFRGPGCGYDKAGRRVRTLIDRRLNPGIRVDLGWQR